LIAACLGACGWTLGPGPETALSVGTVQGASVEPGLRAALQSGLQGSLRGRGVAAGGPAIDVRVLQVEHLPEAAIPGYDAGTVAFAARLVVQVEVLERTGCSVEVEGRRTWIVPGSEPAAAARSRAEAVAGLAVEVADRAVDVVLGKAACR
jgi:hypothetical protein